MIPLASEHSLDLLYIAVWLLVAVGSATFTLALWFIRQFIFRMSRQEAALADIRDLLASEVSKLREMQHDLDKRVIRLESTYNVQHRKDIQAD